VTVLPVKCKLKNSNQCNKYRFSLHFDLSLSDVNVRQGNFVFSVSEARYKDKKFEELIQDLTKPDDESKQVSWIVHFER
jgi:hypothetical protein